MNFKKIIVPTDLSEASKAALPLVKQYAEDGGAEIKLIYVIPLEHFPEADLFLAGSPDRDKYLESQIKVANHAMKQIIDENLKNCSIETAVIVPEGLSVAEEIVKAAKDFASDAILISGAGKGFFSRLMIGSVVQKVVQLSKCPTIVIPYSGESKEE